MCETMVQGVRLRVDAIVLEDSVKMKVLIDGEVFWLFKFHIFSQVYVNPSDPKEGLYLAVSTEMITNRSELLPWVESC